MMLTQLKRRLRDRAVVTASILLLVGCNAAAAAEPSQMGGRHDNDKKTESPIKHVIVIMGENRTFDHVFATYVPREGEHVDNLLSKGIINKDGSPGPNYAKAAQFSAVDNDIYSISPGAKDAYNRQQHAAGARNLLRTADLLHFREPGCAQWAGMHGHPGLGRTSGLRPAASRICRC